MKRNNFSIFLMVAALVVGTFGGLNAEASKHRKGKKPHHQMKHKKEHAAHHEAMKKDAAPSDQPTDGGPEHVQGADTPQSE